MTYIIFRLLCNLFDLCCINLCKAAKHWDSFLSNCSFSHRVTNAFLGIGLVKVSADRACGEMLDMIRKGRKVISQLESIVFIDLHLIQADEFRNFWIETIRVIERLNE